MGLSSAKSKAKKKANKQAQAAYFKAVSGAKRITPLKRIDTNSASQLQDSMGDDLSYGSKRLAMQADKIAKQINADEGFNEDVGKYNKRYDEIKRQMNGETIKKYGLLKDIDRAQGISYLGLAQVSQSGLDKYDTMEEAELANVEKAKQVSEESRPKMVGAVGMLGLNPTFNAPQTNQTLGGGMNKILNTGPQTPKSGYSVRETPLAPINASYRTLSQTKSAYNDLDKLSQNISKSGVNQYAESYEILAQKLKGRLKNETNSLPKANLNSPDIFSGAPKQEVIR